jgi:hypothetical protein
MAIGAVDPLDARAHEAGELEEGDPGGDRERAVRVSERVRAPVGEAGGPDGRVPVVATPVVQVQVAATLAGEEERGIEQRRELVERLGGSQR